MQKRYAGWIQKSRPLRALDMLAHNLMEHNVPRNAAALAYYLLFAIFPLLIFISNLLGMLKLDVPQITRVLTAVLPADILNLLTAYLNYVSHTSSHTLMWFSLVFSVWFPMRAARGLMDDVRRAHQLARPGHPILYLAKQLLFTLVLLVVIVLTLLLSTISPRLLDYLLNRSSLLKRLNMDVLLALWHYLRFAVAGLVMLSMLAALYILPHDRRPRIRSILPGVLLAIVAWLAVSVGYSYYVDHFSNYSVIYGALGAMMALLVWLYMSAFILILGAEVNAVLLSLRRGKQGGKQDNVHSLDTSGQ